MFGSLAASGSSKAKGWILVALTAAILVVLFLLADLGSQFRLRRAVQDVASGAYQNLVHRPAPRPNYPQVQGEGRERTAR